MIVRSANPSLPPLQDTSIVFAESSSNSGWSIVNSADIEEQPSISIIVIE